MKKFDSVDQFFECIEHSPTGMKKLRKICLSMGIDETLKWSMPVYVANKRNVMGLFSSKYYFGIWFYQGALLSDPDGVLINAQQEKTVAMRQWRFTNAKDIKPGPIKKYILEAMALAEAGKEIKPNRNKPVIVPVELEVALAKNKKAGKIFEGMSKSCRREYADYISDAKQPDTKIRRIEKIIPMIVESVGLNDKYR